MPFSAVPKSLVIFSSPETLNRLRLDKEHKALDQVLLSHSLPEIVIRRIQAATLFDVAAALREQNYELILFSCHGDEQGLYLEGLANPTSVPWALLAKSLSDGAPSLTAVILNACFSVTAEQALLAATPFLVVMDGEIDDSAAITFSQYFLDEYYRSTSIEQAFHRATSCIDQMGLGEKIKPVLCRRHPSGRSVFQACFSRRQDSIFIDLSEAEESISNLPISRHEFLSLLTSKIRIHSWIFRVEREETLIPIGQFFGLFSWRNAKDVVVCHDVLRLRPDIDIEQCMGWTRLMVTYNDLRSEPYRVIASPAAIENKVLLFNALEKLETCYTHTLTGSDVVPAAQKLSPRQYAVTLATVRVQCDLARRDLTETKLSGVVIALETAISSIHDLVKDLTAVVTIKGKGADTAQ